MTAETESETERRLREAEAEIGRLREALLDATANLVGAASAYRTYARRHHLLTPKAETDPFFTTRVADFERAAERAQDAVRASFGTAGDGPDADDPEPPSAPRM